jgi:hypothetical protein
MSSVYYSSGRSTRHALRCTHPHKPLSPLIGYLKMNVVTYYCKISGWWEPRISEVVKLLWGYRGLHVGKCQWKKRAYYMYNRLCVGIWEIRSCSKFWGESSFGAHLKYLCYLWDFEFQVFLYSEYGKILSKLLKNKLFKPFIYPIVCETWTYDCPVTMNIKYITYESVDWSHLAQDSLLAGLGLWNFSVLKG